MVFGRSSGRGGVGIGADRRSGLFTVRRGGRGVSRWRRHSCGFRRCRSIQRIGGAGTQRCDGAGDDE
eukprot:5136289-Pleurochrysis_carterae.AAC.1